MTSGLHSQHLGHTIKKKGGSGSQKLKRQHRSKHPITTGLQTTNTVNKNKILGQMLIRSNASFSF